MNDPIGLIPRAVANTIKSYDCNYDSRDIIKPNFAIRYFPIIIYGFIEKILA